ncbi:hypothetical protein SAMD00019534_081830 [Acytostelium subglobosum LB1]|uniref:hypothetical protein n=1 Tax=Acytostelium subglobosum LB1 TaxID=1410327 RepID=UPI000644DA58|nr:hypothetical protein SAMD00019534_081830 [Acytostelium subglobosum LB1]GAM25008.1 hypothetical protein SAMD00019534_081830 [Acytostelium subglobosum LB1]|eukprot:XP_012752097.1 hypothetical protein SAMD00019534_081830 [Acytostelium subglobosum LB1]
MDRAFMEIYSRQARFTWQTFLQENRYLLPGKLANLYKLEKYDDAKEILLRFDSNGESILHTAGSATYDMMPILEQELSKIYKMFPDLLNLKNEAEETPLHVATIHGHKNILRFLVQVEADGSLVDCRNLTALDIATWLKSAELIDQLRKLKSSILTVYNESTNANNGNSTGNNNGQPFVPIYQWGQMLTSGLTLTSLPVASSILFNHVEHAPTTIKFGNNFAMLLTDTGQVYSWGLCSYGKLGHPTKRDIAIPSPISAFRNKQIISISCGKDHSLALDEIGVVYSWGNNTGGRLGLGTTGDFIFSPTIIPFFEDQCVASISCGQEFSMALCNGGSLYSWGQGTMGNLGYKVEGGLNFQKSPRLVKDLPPSKQVSCGNWHTMVLSEEGEVYTFGSNRDGRLGVASPDSTHIPQRVKLDKSIKKIGAGLNFNAVLSEHSNFVFTWGSNENSQLGVLLEGHKKSTWMPQLVRALLPYPINTIEVGYEHVVVLTDTGEVITFGSNSHQQCGDGEPIKEVCNFTKVRVPTNSPVFKIAAGSNSSLISLTSGHSLFGTELSSLLADTSFVDLRLTSRGNRGDPVDCHRIILASRAYKLHILMVMEMGNPNGGHKISLSMTSHVYSSTVDNIIYIDFPDTSLDALRLLVKFMYTDHAHLSPSVVDELGLVSSGLGLERLAYLCNLGKTKSLELMPSSSLVDDLAKLKDSDFSSHYHDVKFNLHDQQQGQDTVEPQVVPSFKVILCLRSPYFSMMLKGQFVETGMDSIDMHEISVTGFRSLLRYFYTNEVPDDPNECVELIKLADFHQISRAKELCSAVLRQHVDNDSLLNIYQFSLNFNLRVLTVLCEARILKTHRDNIKTLPNFDELSEEAKTSVVNMASTDKLVAAKHVHG